MSKATTNGPTKLGGKVRALRRREGLSQATLAKNLGISASYLNLIESNHRPLPAAVLIQLAQLFQLDLKTFASDEDTRLVSDLTEVFADPMFDAHNLASTDIKEVTSASPAAARAVLSLYRAYQATKESADSLAAQVFEGQDIHGYDQSRLPSEEVSDFIQRNMNHFPQLETGAEDLWEKANLNNDTLYPGLCNFLDERYGIKVQVLRWGTDKGTLRRYDADKRILTLSELLPTRSRNFQIAAQIGLLTQNEVLDSLSQDPQLSTAESRRLARVTLANYFAGAVLMPYEPFRKAATEERYDIDVIGRRFRVGFEQVCHRFTTLRRPGSEGVPFHMIRIDVAGNISKRFSASGIHFARYSGACPRWNIFAAFMTPGMIRIQMSKMPEGQAFFCIARAVQRDSAGYHSQQPVHAIGLGCQAQYAREMVYADGFDVDNDEVCVPVGVTCRLCERSDCQQRAFPSLRHPLRIDENVRSITLYTLANHKRLVGLSNIANSARQATRNHFLLTIFLSP
jgi:predicted transcriptional regulator/DNA-binding XRE family transcriptional regulator